MWRSRRYLRDLVVRNEELKWQYWQLSSEVVDLRIDNENLTRKVAELEELLRK